MNIVVLYQYLPHPNATRGDLVYGFNFIKYFSKNHGIFLVSFCNREDFHYVKAMRKYCKKIIVVQKKQSKVIDLIRFLKSLFSRIPNILDFHYDQRLDLGFKKILETTQIDYVFCNRFSMYRYIEKNKSTLKEVKTFIREDPLLYFQMSDSLFFNFKSLLFSWLDIFKNISNYRTFLNNIINNIQNFQYKKVKRYQITAWRDIDLVSAVNPSEKQLIEKLSKKKVFLHPNAVEFDIDSINNRIREPNSLFFIGNYHYSSNTTGVLFFLRKVLPKLIKNNRNIKLYLAGLHPSKKMFAMEKKFPQNIIILGKIKDPMTYLTSKSVFVAPLFSGGGQRIKLLFAMYAKIPIITTKKCIEEFYVRPIIGKEILMANSSTEFINEIQLLLKNHKLNRELGQNGYRFLNKHYSYIDIFKKMENQLINIRL